MPGSFQAHIAHALSFSYLIISLESWCSLAPAYYNVPPNPNLYHC